MNPFIALAFIVAAAVGGAYYLREREDYAGVDPEAPIPSDNSDGDSIEGLARALSSEAPHGRYTEAERVAIAWCAINYCKRIRRTISAVMLPPHHQKGYFCSTFQSATDEDLTLAEAVLSGHYVDPTGGAISFFEPGMQSSNRLTADEVREKWTTKDGLELSTVIGRWEFYRKQTKARVS